MAVVGPAENKGIHQQDGITRQHQHTPPPHQFMEAIGYQPDAKNQFKDDGSPGHQKREIEGEEVIAVNINLELVHIENFQHG